MIVSINGCGITSRKSCRITQEKPEVCVLGCSLRGPLCIIRGRLVIVLVECLLCRPGLPRHLDARTPSHPAFRGRHRGSSLPAARGLFFPWLLGGFELCPLISNVCANPVRLASSTQQAIRHDRFLNIPFPGCGLPTVRLAVRSDAYTVASVGHESRSGAG